MKQIELTKARLHLLLLLVQALDPPERSGTVNLSMGQDQDGEFELELPNKNHSGSGSVLEALLHFILLCFYITYHCALRHLIKVVWGTDGIGGAGAGFRFLVGAIQLFRLLVLCLIITHCFM